MKSAHVTLIFLGFFALIGAAVYFTSSAFPLICLLLAPSYGSKNNEK